MRGLVWSHGRGRLVLGLVLFASVLALWLLSAAGAFRIADGYIYDLFMTLSVEPAEGSGDLLVIEGPPDAGDAAAWDWAALVAALQAFEPARILFTFDPGAGVGGGDGAPRQDAPVIIGRPAWLEADPEAGQAWSLAEPPQAAAATGVVLVAPAEHGIFREQRAVLEVGGETLPTIELAAARDAFGPDWTPPAPSFLVDVRGGAGGLPKVGLEHALSGGGLVEGLVRDKTILVGLAPGPGEGRVHLPLLGAAPVSQLEFHGLALRTLLAGAPLERMGAPGDALLLLVTGAFGALVYGLARVENTLWLMLAGLLLVLGASFALFRSTGLFPPVVELLLVQVLAGLTLWQGSLRRHSAGLQAALGRVRGRAGPGMGERPDDPWAEVAGLVDQVLDLERCVFFEVEPGGARLRLAAAARCTAEDVDAVPLDLGQPPHAAAIRERGLVALTEPGSTPPPAREEYVIALRFAGEVIGIWAFEVDATVARTAEGFEPTVLALAEHLAALIRLSRAQDEAPGGRLAALRRRLAPRRADLELVEGVELLVQRMDLLSEALSGGSTATAVYDVFGRPRYANRRMAEVARAAGIDPTSTSLLDLIGRVTGAAPARARALLRSVLLDRQRLALSSAMAPGGQHLLLSLAPGTGEPVHDGSGAAAGHGVLCELADVTPVARLLELKRTIARHLDFQLRNDLESVTLAASLLGDPRLPAARRSRVLEMLQAAVRRSRAKLEDTNLHLETAAVEPVAVTESYPLDPRQPVAAAIGSLTDEAQRRRVTFETDFPPFVGLVLAGDRELRDLVAAILAALVQDARDGTAVAARLLEEERMTTLTFTNSGFGLPEERLQEHLFREGAFASSEFQAIRSALPHLERWGGALRARGRLGEGLAFDLQLKRAA